MSTEMIGLLGTAILLVLIFSKIWIGVAFVIVGFFGYAYLDGWTNAFSMVGSEPFLQGSSYTLTAIPLFILMGIVIFNTGIGEDLYNAARAWLGRLRGGLAIASVAASGAFAAMCGSSLATSVTLGKMAYPEMVRNNYDKSLAAGCIAAGGTVGILIPPSIGFIMFGLITETSIGRLFIAGIIPGITEVLFYIITITIMCNLNPRLGPVLEQRFSLKEKFASLKYCWPMVAIFFIVIGGIYAGMFTATEAGAIGAFGAIVISLVQRRLTTKNFFASLTETAQSAAMIIFLLSGSFVYLRFLTISRLPIVLSNYVAGLSIPPFMIILVICLFYIFTGCLMDVTANMILTLPIIFPIVTAVGFNPYWFGVVMVRMMEIGSITPPMGINVFVLAKSIDAPMGTVFRGILPFVLTDFVHVAVLIALPQLSLFLLQTM